MPYQRVHRTRWRAADPHSSPEEQLTVTPTECEFDVFIPYSSHDKVWVRGELLKRIENAGLEALIDFRDFTRGAPSIKECERGVEKCRKTLIVLTPEYLNDNSPLPAHFQRSPPTLLRTMYFAPIAVNTSPVDARPTNSLLARPCAACNSLLAIRNSPLAPRCLVASLPPSARVS